MRRHENHRKYVLDANAVIGLLEDRRGVAEKVWHLITEAGKRETPLLMSAVNWGEVIYIAWRHHAESGARLAETRLQQLPIWVIAVDRERATRAAALKEKHSLGYADSFAAELAVDRKAWLVTADPDFQRLGRLLSIYSLPRHQH